MEGREGEEEDLLPAHPILCQSSLAVAQVQAGVLRGACLLLIIPPICHIVISFIHNLLSRADKSESNECQRVSLRFHFVSIRPSVRPSLASGPTLPPSHAPPSRGIRSLPENSSFVTVGQLNVTLAALPPSVPPSLAHSVSSSISSILDLRQG